MIFSKKAQILDFVELIFIIFLVMLLLGASVFFTNSKDNSADRTTYFTGVEALSDHSIQARQAQSENKPLDELFTKRFEIKRGVKPPVVSKGDQYK